MNRVSILICLIFWKCVGYSFLLILFGCHPEENHRVSENSHVILIGGSSEPPYSELEIGQRYEAENAVGIFGIGPLGETEFGRLETYRDGKLFEVHSRGGIGVLTEASLVELKGELRFDLIVLVFEKSKADRGLMLKHKEVLKATDDLYWSIELE